MKAVKDIFKKHLNAFLAQNVVSKSEFKKAFERAEKEVLREIETNWQIEKVERYYYLSGRNSTTYVEMTFWYNPAFLERRETKRTHFCYDSEAWKRPEWCQSIAYHNKAMDYDN